MVSTEHWKCHMYFRISRSTWKHNFFAVSLRNGFTPFCITLKKCNATLILHEWYQKQVHIICFLRITSTGSVPKYASYTYIDVAPICSFKHSLQWRHNGHDGVSNTSPTIVYSAVYTGANERKTPKLRVTGICAGKSPVTTEFLAQKASNAGNVSIWWRHRVSCGFKDRSASVCRHFERHKKWTLS